MTFPCSRWATHRRRYAVATAELLSLCTAEGVPFAAARAEIVRRISAHAQAPHVAALGVLLDFRAGVWPGDLCAEYEAELYTLRRMCTAQEFTTALDDLRHHHARDGAVPLAAIRDIQHQITQGAWSP